MFHLVLRSGFGRAVVCLACLFSVTDYSRADVILHIGAGGTGSGGGNLPYFQSGISSPNGTVGGAGTGTGNGIATVSSSTTQPVQWLSGPIASFSSSSTSDRAGNLVPEAVGSTAAIYGDEITLIGSDPVPSAIRLHYEVTGSMSVAPVGNSVFARSQSLFFANGTSVAGSFSGSSTGIEALTLTAGSVVNDRIAELTLTRDWDDFSQSMQSSKVASSDFNTLTASSSGGAFTGTFFQDVLYDSALDGFDFETLFGVRTSAGDSMASGSASVELTGVTDLSGNPLSAFQINFASGRTFNAVPEPNSVSIFGIAYLLLLRRKRLAAV